jgi:hypothetical protein
MNVTQMAIDQVEQNANPDWMQVARLAVVSLAKSGQPFTADDVWDRLATESAVTHEPRALGAVMRNVAAAGLIRTTGAYVKSRRRETHYRPVAVWVLA